MDDKRAQAEMQVADEEAALEALQQAGVPRSRGNEAAVVSEDHLSADVQDDPSRAQIHYGSRHEGEAFDPRLVSTAAPERPESPSPSFGSVQGRFDGETLELPGERGEYFFQQIPGGGFSIRHLESGLEARVDAIAYARFGELTVSGEFLTRSNPEIDAVPEKGHGAPQPAADPSQEILAQPNTAPEVGAPHLRMEEGRSVTFTEADLLTGASDADGDTLTVVSVLGADDGALVDNGDGTWTYTPEGAFTGLENLQFTVSDGRGGETDASLAIEVMPVITGTSGSETLVGSDVGEVIRGGSGHDRINAAGGDDVIIGGQHNDTLDGGAGSDTFQVGGQGDGYDRYTDSGTEGTDRIVATADNTRIGVNGFGPASGIEEISADGHANVTLSGTSSSDTLDFSATDLTGITAIEGGSGHDRITGSAGDDTLIGGQHNDTLDGGAGSDTFQVGGQGDGYDRYTDSGTEGTDRIVATADNTRIGVNGFGPASGIEEISADGHANVTLSGTSSSDTLDFSATDLTGITAIEGGSGHDRITGSAGDDTLIGGQHNDTLDGGAGSDTFQVGGQGDGYDRYTDSGTEGTDRIVATADNTRIGVNGFGPASGIEEISADGHANVTLSGTSSSDTLDFSATDLTGITAIEGGSGHDRITGSAGDDTLIGGQHNDTLDGGAGSDTFQVGGQGDGYDRYTDSGTEGTDRIVATADNTRIGVNGFGPASGIEEISADGHANVTLSGTSSSDTLDFSATDLTGITAIEGGSGHDRITGSAGDDTLIGGQHNDTLDGGAGSDTFQVGGQGDGYDRYTDSGTEGTDRIVATADNTRIGVNGFGPASGIEEISADGHANVTLSGTSSSDTLDFSATDLTGITAIEGGSGHDRITGSAGDDTLIGGQHNDTLDGGAGSDTFQVGGQGDGYDRYTDSGTEGTDRIVATADNTRIGVNGFGPASGIEEISADGHANVTLSGTSSSDTLDFSATDLTGITAIEGGSGHDRITGSAGDDTLIGGQHNDTLRGGTGNDQLFGGAGDDRFVFDLSEGIGSDGVDGGFGWDTIDLTEAGDWTMAFDDGSSVTSEDQPGGVFSDDAGTIDFTGGDRVSFENVESFTW